MKKLWSLIAMMHLTCALFAAVDDTGIYTYEVTDGAAKITDVDESLLSGDVVIPATLGGAPVVTIGESAFIEDLDVTSVTIPSSVTLIENYAFQRCKGLESVTLPPNLTSIGYGAFSTCTSLTSIDIPEGVAIAPEAFHSCKSLTRIDTPAGVTFPGYNIFELCSGLTHVTIGKGATSIGDSMFLTCSGLTHVAMSSTIETIKPHAFSECSSLTDIRIPSSVKTIGSSAFSECENLAEIAFSGAPPEVEKGAFDNLSSSIIGVYNPNYSEAWASVIVDGMWNGIPMKKRDAPLPEELFLFEINKGKVTIIGYNGTVPSELSIPATLDGCPVVAIGESAFANTTLTKVTLPEGVTTIGAYAFNACRSLESIHIPDSVVAMGSSVFQSCGNLPEDENGVRYESDAKKVLILGPAEVSGGLFTVPSTVKFIHSGAFSTGKNLSKVVIPEGVISIGGSAFAYCSTLLAVELPNSLTSIGKKAFYGCSSLPSITIPKGVTSLGDSVFYACDVLDSVNFLGAPPAITSLGFDSTRVEVMGYYPSGYYPSTQREAWEKVIDDQGIWQWMKMEMKEVPDNPIPSETPNVILKECCEPEAAGKLTGAKSYKVGKKATVKAKAAKGSLFAGWYLDENCDVPYKGAVDYRNPSLPIMMEAFTLSLWGKFIPKSGENGTLKISWPKDASDYDAQYRIGDEVKLTVMVDSQSLPKLSVKGLPKGLKWDSKTFTIIGKPTTPGIFTVTMTATNAVVKKGTAQKFLFRVLNRNELMVNDTEYDPDEIAHVYAGQDYSLPEDSAIARLFKTLNEDCADAKISVKGLPSGLKWKDCKIIGWPKTVKADKEFYTVTFTVTRGRVKLTTTVTFKVVNREVEARFDEALGLATYTVYVGEKTELNAVDETLVVKYTGDSDEVKMPASAYTLKVSKGNPLPKGLSLKYNKTTDAYDIVGTPKAEKLSPEGYTRHVSVTATDKRLKKTTASAVAGIIIHVKPLPEETKGDLYALQTPTDSQPGLYVAINRPKGGGKATLETATDKYSLSFCASREEAEDSTYHAYYRKGTLASGTVAPAVDFTPSALTVTLPDGTTTTPLVWYEKVPLPEGYDPQLVTLNDLAGADEGTATLTIDKKGTVTGTWTSATNAKLRVKLTGVLLRQERITSPDVDPLDETPPAVTPEYDYFIYIFGKPDIFEKIAIPELGTTETTAL